MLYCANATGTHHVKFLVTGKYQCTQALKSVWYLPVEYTGQSNSWMDKRFLSISFAILSFLWCKNISTRKACLKTANAFCYLIITMHELGTWTAIGKYFFPSSKCESPYETYGPRSHTNYEVVLLMVVRHDRMQVKIMDRLEAVTARQRHGKHD